MVKPATRTVAGFFFGKTNERNITDKVELNNWQYETSLPCWGISPQLRFFNVAFLTEDHMVKDSLSPRTHRAISVILHMWRPLLFAVVLLAILFCSALSFAQILG